MNASKNSLAVLTLWLHQWYLLVGDAADPFTKGKLLLDILVAALLNGCFKRNSES